MKTFKGESLPTIYEAAVLKKENTPLEIENKQITGLSKGEVWVKIKAAPVNPSDLAMLIGMYPHKKKHPYVPGLEGSGIVVASGGGFMANYLLGKRVICTAPEENDGTWAEYMKVEAGKCIPMKKSLSFEQGAYAIVNPMTALALIERIKKSGGKAFINTAAASALGKMLIRLSKKEGLTPINIVRRPEQVEILQTEGTQYILDSSSDTFQEQFRELIQKLNPTLLLDAISGDFPGQLLSEMPSESTLIAYANLSRSDLHVPIMPITRFGKKVEGFHLAHWSSNQSLIKLLKSSRKAQNLIKDGTFATHIHYKTGLKDLNAGIENYANKMSSGKCLLIFE